MMKLIGQDRRWAIVVACLACMSMVEPAQAVIEKCRDIYG
jgi:hypothetical protein